MTIGRTHIGAGRPLWAKTPPEIVKRMNEELNKALKSPGIAARLAGQASA